MPALGSRLRDALRDTARLPEADGVLEQVTTKRRRRQVRRRAATGATAAALLVGATGVTVLVLDRDPNPEGRDVRVATDAPPTTIAGPPAPPDAAAARAEIAAALPDGRIEKVAFVSATEAVVNGASSPAGVRVEVVDGRWQVTPASACRFPNTFCDAAPPEPRASDGPVPLGPDAYGGTRAEVSEIAVEPDEGSLRAPIVSTDRNVWIAAKNPSGDGFRLLRLGLDGAVDRRAELEGEVLSFAVGEDAGWAVTHERFIDTDQVEYRLKRIDLETGAVVSHPIPPGRVPAGRVVAGAAGVWVPARDGVLRFDPETGAFAEEAPLPDQEQRAVAITGGAVWATNETTLEQVGREGELVTVGKLRVDTSAGSPLVDLVTSPSGVWAVSADEVIRMSRDLGSVKVRIPLPDGLADAQLAASGDRVMVTGHADLAPPTTGEATSVAVEPVALPLRDSAIAKTVVLAGAIDAAVTTTSDGDLLVTSTGRLYSVALP